MSGSQVLTAPQWAPKHSSQGDNISIGIAGIDVVKSPSRIRTVLGSCIGVALFDCVAKIGGMAHVILPASSEGTGNPAKFADTAVDLLLEMVLESGAKQERLAAKIVGGAVMFGDATSESLGLRNAEGVKQRLTHHKIRLVAEAIGGTKGRKMMLDPVDGSVKVEIIGEQAELI